VGGLKRDQMPGNIPPEKYNATEYVGLTPEMLEALSKATSDKGVLKEKIIGDLFDLIIARLGADPPKLIGIMQHARTNEFEKGELTLDYQRMVEEQLKFYEVITGACSRAMAKPEFENTTSEIQLKMIEEEIFESEE
jgi:hypothetical protein